eukprot:scaffold463060_cov44-Prasinocladus_malaysianus.AAC.1
MGWSVLPKSRGSREWPVERPIGRPATVPEEEERPALSPTTFLSRLSLSGPSTASPRKLVRSGSDLWRRARALLMSGSAAR